MKKNIFPIIIAALMIAAVYFRSVFLRDETPVETAAACCADSLPSPTLLPPQPKPLPHGLVRIRDIDASIFIDLKYATTDNFTGKILYYDTVAYLQRETAEKLHAAGQRLKSLRPDLRLLVYDATRPLNVQKKMWEAVQNTPYRRYVADPKRTSLHNYGAAVDLTLADRNGKPLDMGTAFDHFGEAANVVREDDLLKRGILTPQQVKNRRLLREVMQASGFQSISGEWWHFNACTLAEAQERYPLLSHSDTLLNLFFLPSRPTVATPDSLPDKP